MKKQTTQTKLSSLEELGAYKDKFGGGRSPTKAQAKAPKAPKEPTKPKRKPRPTTKVVPPDRSHVDLLIADVKSALEEILSFWMPKPLFFRTLNMKTRVLEEVGKEDVSEEYLNAVLHNLKHGIAAAAEQRAAYRRARNERLRKEKGGNKPLATPAE